MLYQQTAILLIPFLGTSLGSAMVFFTKNKINEKFQKFFVPRRVKRGVQVGQPLTVGCHRQRRVIAAPAGDIADALVLHPGRPAVQQRCAFVRQKPRNAAQHRFCRLQYG